MRRILYNRDRKQRSVWLLACVLLIAVLATTAFSLESYAETLTETLVPTTIPTNDDVTPTASPIPTASSHRVYLPLLMREHQHPYTTLERMGFCAAYGTASNYPDLEDLYGLYADYNYRITLPSIGNAEYVQMIMVREPIYGADPEGRDSDYLSQVGAAATANPGSLWIIGNEPECPKNQGARTPEEYAVIYHTCYTAIKEVDPTARVAVGGVVEPTPLRLEWLNRVLAYYGLTYGESMPVDVWTVHNQILPEYANESASGAGIPVGIDAEQGEAYEMTDVDDMTIFANHITTFRQWMADHGYRDCELIISEYGFLYFPEYFDWAAGCETMDCGIGEARMETFIEESYRYMLSATNSEIGCPSDGYLLVQRWLWYSMAHPGLNDEQADANERFGGALCDPYTNELNPLGEFYLDLVPRLIAEFDS